MATSTPPNANDVRKIVEDRLRAKAANEGDQETVTVEWRDRQQPIPVISMPVKLLYYNPDSHRVRAQRSTDPIRERSLETNPYGEDAQNYLHQLLMGDPKDPSTIDPSFTALEDDLKEHGQNDPGIITRFGVLINGNTRRAALKDIGQENIRVGVLPQDAGFEDTRSIELSLQLRKDHKRDYSFMNSLLAIDERVAAGQLATKIQNEFRIKSGTYEQRRWILGLVRDAIERSQTIGANNRKLAMRLVDFESHQGKLEELYRAYSALKLKGASDQAEALKEQRLMALVLDKSKTDLRLIEADFVQRYMKNALPSSAPTTTLAQKIPGTSIKVPGPSQEIQALRQLTTSILSAKAIAIEPGAAATAQVTNATDLLGRIGESVVTALDHAGKQGRVVKKRLAPVDRISDACDDLEFAVSAVAEARSTGNFDPTDLDEILVTLKTNLSKLSAIVARGSDSDSEGIAWIREVGNLGRQNS